MADGTTTIDDLQIEIGAKAQTANDAIDRLVTKLDRLQTSLSKVNGSQLTGLANGVDRLGKSMQVMNTIKTADFTRLATNLTKLGNINVSALNSSASSLSHLSRAFNTLGNASQNAQSVVTMASSLSKLGGASVQRAITNIPLLATAMNNLMVTLSRSPRVSNNVIQLTNALANLASQGARVGTASNSIENGLNRANNSATRTSKSFGGLASAIGRFYATYFMVIRGIKGLYKSIESTADYVEAFNYYTVSFGKIAERWDKDWENYGDENARNYSNSFVKTINSTFSKLSGVSFDPKTGLLSETGLKNLGLNLQQITQYAAQLGSMLDAVGQSGETTLATTNAFVKLAGDISSLYNIDYQKAADKIRSVLQGQSRAGYGFGWDTTMASLQATADKFNLSKPVSEMAQFEKQQLRILTILEQSRVAWGDQSNTLNTLANQMRIFKNNVSEVAMMLGQLFVPVLEKIMPIVNGITIAIKRLLGSFANLLGIKIGDTGQGFKSMEEDASGFADSLDDATASAKKLKSVTLGIDELNINAPQEDTGKTTGGVGGGIDLTNEILEATSEYEKVWNDAFKNMENKAQEWANRIEKIFEPITAPIQNLMYHISRGEWDIAGNDASNIAIGIFDLFTKAIDKVNWKNIGKEIGEFFKGLDWKEIISSAGNFLETALDAAGDLLEGAFDADPIATTIVTALGIAKFSGLNTTLKDKIISACPTNVSIGKTILISGITWEIGFDFGKKLAAGFADTEEEYQEIMNFSWFDKDGFFNTAFTDARSAIQGFGKLFDADESGLISIISTAFFGPIGTTIGNGINLLSEETFINFGNWFNESVAPWFTKEKWTELAMNIPIAISNKWQEFTKWWETSGVKKWFDEKVKPWFTKETWETNISGIKTAFSNTFKNVANGVIGWLNKIISAIESLVNNAISGLDGISDLINEIPGVEIEVSAPTITLPRIPTYRFGGYDIPEDGWFRASKGEYFGQFDDGTSYIANNNQIEAGISVGVGQAVREAVSEILAPYLADIAQNTRETADKEWTTNFGDREIARANARGQRSLGYALIT